MEIIIKTTAGQIETTPELTAAIERYVECEKARETAREILDRADQATADLVAAVGIGTYIRDSAGIVHKTVIPDGRFVHFQHVGTVRTKREGEERGSLSVKEAVAAGMMS